MGTRSLSGFIDQGRIIASYAQYDGYPSAVGTDVLTFARGITDLDALRLQVLDLVPVDATGTPLPEEQEQLRALGIAPQQVSTGDDWYAWLRNSQGDLHEMLRVGYFTDDATFLQDTLFCEWAYLIDLDKRALHVYRGTTEPVVSLPLSDLPTDADFVRDLEE